MGAFNVRRIGYAAGAEITGLDLNQPLEPEVAAGLRRAWLDHQVLCFPDQKIESKDAFAAFTANFGEVDARPGMTSNRDGDHPAIILITNKPRNGKPYDGVKQGELWHSDQSYTLHPSPGTFILAKEIPPVGGDTMFANMYMAYDALSPAMQKLAESLSAVHDWAEVNLGAGKRSLESHAAEAKKYPAVVHPLVTVHPETGRKALYAGDRVREIDGMTREESRPLLDFFNAHAVRYEFVYRHRWRANDLIMWDNRCLMHYAVADYDQFKQIRHFWRCPLLGPRQGRLFEPPAQPEPAGAGAG